MTRARQLALLAAAGAHLALVAAYASGWEVPRRAPGRAIAWYAAISGAEAVYSFFVPSVDAEIRPVLEVTDCSGRVTRLPLENAMNTEVDLRVGDLVTLAWTEDHTLREALVRACARAALRRCPDAERVAVKLEYLHIPSMRGYRRGERPTWVPWIEETITPDRSGGT